MHSDFCACVPCTCTCTSTCTSTSTFRAHDQNRTGDLFITNEVLCRLSYVSTTTSTLPPPTPKPPPPSVPCGAHTANRQPPTANCQPIQSGRRGSNPRHQAWKACALPAELLPRVRCSAITTPFRHRNRLSGGGRIRTFEGISRQIYSLLPLATWVPHLILLCPSTNPPPGTNRADGESRTRNRLITNQVLCQLSYVSDWLS